MNADTKHLTIPQCKMKYDKIDDVCSLFAKYSEHIFVSANTKGYTSHWETAETYCNNLR